MKKIIKNLLLSSLLMLLTTCDNASKSEAPKESGNTVTIKVFSSLTCPHCANFHNQVFENLKDEYIAVGATVPLCSMELLQHDAFTLDRIALISLRISS